MTAQLPGSGETFLDHVAHFVPDIEAASAALERCGFRLTPFTAQANREGGVTIPSGTGNRCAMLRSGYVEILAATADTDLARQLRERLGHHVGLHLAAFGTADAAAEHRRLGESGFDTLPLVDMRRPVALAAGIEEAHFTIARVMPGTMAEGRTQFLTHHTEHLVWRPDHLDHPNGAVALEALWLMADDPAEPAARFARFTGRDAEHRGDAATIRLDRGAITIATPAYLNAQFGILPPGKPPCLVATTIAVASLDRLHECLYRGGIGSRPIDLAGAAAVAVALPRAVGDTILFRAVTAAAA